MGAVDVKQTQEHELTLEWDSSASNDMLADSTLALITGIDKSPASVKSEQVPLMGFSIIYIYVGKSYIAATHPLQIGLGLASSRGLSRSGNAHKTTCVVS